MQLALDASENAIGFSKPNPPVGAIIVKDDKVIATGWTGEPGEPHAERSAIQNCLYDMVGASLYVTLEPCSHYGRTAPCIEVILESGISKVYVALKDPYKEVNGKGIKKLIDAGVSVFVGDKNLEAINIMEAHFKHSKTGMPFVTAKFAMSLDGKIATSKGDSKWITNESSRDYAHYLRFKNDAVMIGSNTAIIDNPKLTVRSKKLPHLSKKHQPLRIVIDSQLKIPKTHNIYNDQAETLFVVSDNIENLNERDINHVPLSYNDNRIDLLALLKNLGNRNIKSVLVEGGGELIGSLFDLGLVDKIEAFIAPMVIGGRNSVTAIKGLGAGLISEAVRLNNITIRNFDSDTLITGYCEKNTNVYRNN
jgi:diaminohydroxyphosphoribosylaminopyrimidine deaminase/5-amino-6-(5-phosphoribosylamino)uracil reductase